MDSRSYNSAIFSSLASNSYSWLVVKPEFLHGADWNLPAANATIYARGNEMVMGLVEDQGEPVSQPLFHSVYPRRILWPKMEAVSEMQIAAAKGIDLVRLEKLQCLEQYLSAFGKRSDLLMVASAGYTNNNSVLVAGSIGYAVEFLGSWMCRSSNTFSCVKLSSGRYDDRDKIAVVANWNMLGYEIDYCLASYKSLDDSCSLVYSYKIMIGKSTLLLGCKSRPLTRVQLSVLSMLANAFASYTRLFDTPNMKTRPSSS